MNSWLFSPTPFDATNVQQAQDFSIVFENIDLTKIGFLPQIDIDDSGSV